MVNKFSTILDPTLLTIQPNFKLLSVLYILGNKLGRELMYMIKFDSLFVNVGYTLKTTCMVLVSLFQLRFETQISNLFTLRCKFLATRLIKKKHVYDSNLHLTDMKKIK